MASTGDLARAFTRSLLVEGLAFFRAARHCRLAQALALGCWLGVAGS